MNFRFVAGTCLIVALFTTIFATTNYAGATMRSSSLELPLTPCLPKQDLTHTIDEFSTSQTHAEMEKARLRLTAVANSSAACREQVVAQLIKAMDKPEFDTYRDFELWRYGSKVLGDLNATEALDLLITHLDITDDASINITHYPAMGAVIKIGQPAIPKLQVALQQNSDSRYRFKAVFCIAEIGGSAAVRVLTNAVSLETHSCLRKFMQLSIDVLSDPQNPGQIQIKDRDRWFAALSCSE